jgi:pectinesterase
MRKSSAGLVVSVVLALSAWGCGDGGGGGGKGGTSGGKGGTGGALGSAGNGGGSGGAPAGSAGSGGALAGSGGNAGATAGSGGAAGATGGATAGSGGAAGATGGSTAGSGGAAGATGGSGGAAGATGGAIAGSGGNAGAAGGATAGSGGSVGTGGSGTPAPNPPITGTATRPQLTAGTDYTILKYFEKAGSLVTGLTTDNWDPTPGVGDVATFTPTYTVAATGGTHTSVQAALDAAVAAGGTARVYIKVNPGMYRETICHKANTPPITLYGTDAAQTIIVNNASAGKLYVDAATVPAWNICASGTPPAAGTKYGTSGSATAAIYARDFQAKNLTFANDFDEAGSTTDIQAVALMTQNDKLIFENVRVLGNQDTLYVKTGNVDTVQRAYFKGCYVEGDVDFIFGRATFVLDGCEIKYLGARRGATNGGDIISPSTDFRNAYGLLVIGSMFTSDGVPNAGTVSLGRAWDEGQSAATYPMPGNATGNTGGYPNGQAVVRGSTLGAHLIVATPWDKAASTSRTYSSVAVGAIPANRLWEFQNTGPGAAP